MSPNTHRVYKMISSYKDRDKYGNDIIVELPEPRKKLLGSGKLAHCEAIAAKHKEAIIEPIEGDGPNGYI